MPYLAHSVQPKSQQFASLFGSRLHSVPFQYRGSIGETKWRADDIAQSFDGEDKLERLDK